MLSTRYSDDDEAFCKALKDKRNQAGLSQTDLAEKLGTTQSSISKMERGELRLGVIDFVHVCKAMNIRPGEMLEEVFGR